jgi:preprotein translocase subunit SecF
MARKILYKLLFLAALTLLGLFVSIPSFYKISLAGIIAYLAWRLNFHFSVAAAIGAFHDVLAVLGATINIRINEVLSRTIITSWTVFMVLIALLLLGGLVIYDFALALTMAVVVGTYSSIFVASPYCHRRKMTPLWSSTL